MRGGEGGWADCNGTCSDSNYPWTLAAVEDPLGPRVGIHLEPDPGRLVGHHEQKSCLSHFSWFKTSE